MLRATQRSVSERKRLSTWLQIVLLLPICAVLMYNLRVWNLIPFGSAGPYDVGYERSTVAIKIDDIEQPSGTWSLRRISDTWGVRDVVYVTLVTTTRSRYQGLLVGRPVMRVSRTYQLDEFVAPSYMRGRRADQRARLLGSFEREFGEDWQSLGDADLRSMFLPLVEDEIAAEAAIEAGGDAATRPVFRDSLVKSGFVTVRWSLPVVRADVLSSMFEGTIPLWIALSIGASVVSVVSRERKARRWVAMKCPKCGYERQRDRAECPECGLVYERPSYVLWDPTEDVAEPSKAERNAR